MNDADMEELDDSSLAEEGEEDSIMAWKNLSCSYPSKVTTSYFTTQLNFICIISFGCTYISMIFN